MIHNLSVNKWIAYAKQPFAGPEQVLEYLGRYTHRIAFSNNRLSAVENGQVTFTYRDRSSNNQKKTMTLATDEFIRRFLLHVLPKRLYENQVLWLLIKHQEEGMYPSHQTAH